MRVIVGASVLTGILIAAGAAPCPLPFAPPEGLGFEAMLGTSVALDENLLAVGAPLETGVAWATGAVYVYRLDGGTWTLEAKLIAEDAGWGDMLGVDLDLQGDTIIAGAWFNDAHGSNSGAAYVFTREAPGIWSAPQKLTPPDPGPEDVFGRTVALGDGFCAIGAPLDDDHGPSSGSIHVFNREAGGIWTHAAKLLPPASAEGHQLGLGLAADELHILGGSPWAHEGRGEARLWQRDGAAWLQTWSMSMQSGGAPEDHFGFAVAINGPRLAIGAYRDDTFADDAGSILVADAIDGDWSTELIGPPDPQPGAQFGVSVALSGDVLAVGSRYATVADVPAGRVDIRTGSTWSAAVGAPEPAEDAEFGWSCALSANALVAGAPYQPDSGGVYLWSGISGPCGCQADVNGDGDVGVDDLLTVLEGWGGDGPGGDIDGDGTIGVNDLLALIAAWGPCA